MAFILWGAHARSKKKFIDTSRHRIIESAHPTSRKNAKDPFLKARSFSETNQFLKPPIDWANTEFPST